MFGVRKKTGGAMNFVSAISVMANSLFDKRKSSATPHPSMANMSVPGGPEHSKDSTNSANNVNMADRSVSTTAATNALQPREMSSLKNAVFNGMRVRMGIATGLLPPGSQAKGSAVMDLAKGEALHAARTRGGGH